MTIVTKVSQPWKPFGKSYGEKEGADYTENMQTGSKDQSVFSA